MTCTFQSGLEQWRVYDYDPERVRQHGEIQCLDNYPTISSPKTGLDRQMGVHSQNKWYHSSWYHLFCEVDTHLGFTAVVQIHGSCTIPTYICIPCTPVDMFCTLSTLVFINQLEDN